VRSIIGHGVVVDPIGLLDELETLRAAGVDTESVVLSERAHLIMPFHRQIDLLEEKARGESLIGTTGRGIGPTYADKASRTGLRVCDVLGGSGRVALRSVAQRAVRVLQTYEAADVSAEEIATDYLDAVERLRPIVGDTLAMVHDALERDETILLEGAQGALLDLDTGTYPYVTSSCTLAAGALAGSGVPPSELAGCIGVYKAYPTRVGTGPFPSEMAPDIDAEVREIGHEYGATTGRPRRCGWFDAVTARHSARLNGYSGLVVTHLDVFDTLPTLRICTGYRLRGSVVDRVPALASDLAACEPIYEELPGWRQSTAAIREPKDLPAAAHSYVERIQECVGVPVALVTVGARRDEAIYLRPL
jgi:adenylosuccinate synthase